MTEKADEELAKVKQFAEKVRDLIGQNSNYNTLTVATERYDNGVAIENNPDLHNCVRARVYVRTNEHHRHLDDEKVRERVEQIGSIASGTRATSVTETREAREESRKEHYEKYPGPVKVVKIKGSNNEENVVYEIEYTIPVF